LDFEFTREIPAAATDYETGDRKKQGRVNKKPGFSGRIL
jgi:hypothetical protein